MILATAGGTLSLSGLAMTIASGSGGGVSIDYAGLAALVASITGLISAVGAVIIGLRRRERDPTQQTLELLLRQQEQMMARNKNKAEQPDEQDESRPAKPPAKRQPRRRKTEE